MKVGSKKKMVAANIIINIRMFPAITEACGGE